MFFTSASKLLEQLKTQFRTNQKLSQDIKEEYVELVNRLDRWESIYFGEVTYKMFLESLEKNQEEDFSEEQFQLCTYEGQSKKALKSHLEIALSQHKRLLGLQQEILATTEKS